MEQDQNCVLPETSSGELKLRVPKLSFFEWFASEGKI